MKKWTAMPCNRGRFLASLGAVVLLIAASMAAMYYTISHSREQMLAGYDRQVMGIAEAVGRNMASTLEYYSHSLEYVAGRRGFLEAEQLWLAEGDGESLLYRMEENLVAQAEAVRVMLALRDGEVALATDGRPGYYSFPQGEPSPGGGGLLRCVDEDGNNYFAVMYYKEDVCYAALLCLKCLYREIMGDALVGSDNDLYLLDVKNGLMVGHVDGSIQAGLVPGPGEAGYGMGPAQMLLCQQGGEPQMFFYEAQNGDGRTYTARLAVLPAEGGSSYFTVGVVGNYDNVLIPQRQVARGFLLYGGMTVCGILLLIRLLVRARLRGEAAQREMTALRKKNAEMERLNQQTRELAHHQRLEMIGTMTAGLTHEINNLLTPIMGYSIMVMEKLPPDATELYDNMLAIYDSSRKAKEIIARLSALSRKSSALALQNVSPDALARHVLKTAKPVQPETVEIELHLDCGPVRVRGNETQLSQMLLNLVLNSFQAMEQGGRLTLRTWAEEQEAAFCVQDTGPGIPEELQEQVFEPFFTTKGQGKGTGLGLAIVRQVVEENKGRLRLDSRPGEGTAITIWLPRSQEEER